MTKPILLLPKFVLSKMSHESEHSESKFYYSDELSHAELQQQQQQQPLFYTFFYYERYIF